MRFLLVALVLAVSVGSLPAQTPPQFYVSATGSPSGTGSLASPWNLQTALNQPSGVVQGATIWVRGGTYSGTFTSSLTGTANAPIIVRNYQGERVTLDNRTDCTGFAINGSYSWFWGLEITSSGTKRRTPYAGADCHDPETGGILDRGLGFRNNGSYNRLINNVIQHTQNGVANWGTPTSGPGLEIYGNLIAYNGWEQTPSGRGHGHGIYTTSKQNGPTKAEDNIVHSNFSQGIRIGDEFVYAPHVEGNISYLNGEHMTPMGGRNFYIGGSNDHSGAYMPMTDLLFRGNVGYYRDYTGSACVGCAGASENLNAGLWWPTASGSLVNNYLAGLTPAVALLGYWDHFTATTCTGNTIIGPSSPYLRAQCAPTANSYYAGKPTMNHVIVRANRYEPGRGHVAIFNWQNLTSIPINLSSLGLVERQAFDVRDAMNPFGAPVASGVYTAAGPMVTIPMQNLTRAPLSGEADLSPAYVPKPHSAPEFGAFIVVPGAVQPVPSCASDPLVVIVLNWPRATEGDHLLRYIPSVNGSQVTMVSALHLWTPYQHVTITDSRGCSATVRR